jgi:hypothetical protein
VSLKQRGDPARTHRASKAGRAIGDGSWMPQSGTGSAQGDSRQGDDSDRLTR